MRIAKAVLGVSVAVFLLTITRWNPLAAGSLANMMGVRDIAQAQLMFLLVGFVFAVAVAGGGGALWELFHPVESVTPRTRRPASPEEKGMDPERVVRLNLVSSPRRRSSESRPSCPECGAPTVVRTARTGARSGKKFHGCSTFPKCRGVYHDPADFFLE